MVNDKKKCFVRARITGEQFAKLQQFGEVIGSNASDVLRKLIDAGRLEDVESKEVSEGVRTLASGDTLTVNQPTVTTV